MSVIYKYRLCPFGKTKLSIPYLSDDPKWDIHTQIIHIGLEDNHPFVWIQVDPEAKTREVVFGAILTGKHFDGIEPYEFIGTTISQRPKIGGGYEPYVVHYYAREPE